jgi:N-acetylmuramoyl-L-alanine amidase
MKSVSCPSILVECGFLSNPRELALLQTEEYQTKTAVCLSAAFLNTCDILEEVNGKG